MKLQPVNKMSRFCLEDNTGQYLGELTIPPRG